MGDFFSYELLPVIFNMTVTAGVVTLVVLFARFLLRKLGAPAAVSYALWAVVLFRLLCPISFASPFSLVGVLDTPVVTAESGASVIEYVPREIVHMENPSVELPIPVVDNAINAVLPQGEEQLRADPLEAPVAILTMVWLGGVVALVFYSLIVYIRLRRRLVGAVPLEGNIRLADHIGSPFVMGLFRPKIYLPSSLSEPEREYIILHERHHIRRLDHIVKILAFAALCIHWFNPLVWLAFYLSGQDMEMSCDEAVVKKLGGGIRADYSASLLKLSTGRTVIAATPLAFGEGDTGGRIKNLAKWKKPAVWITVIAVILCAVVIVLCATNSKPSADDSEGGQPPEQVEQPEPPRWFGPDQIYVPERCLYMSPLSSFAAMGGDSGYRYVMGDGGFYMIRQDIRSATLLAEAGLPQKIEIPLVEGDGWAKWEEFPWTDEEWEAMFWPDGMWKLDISGCRERKYCALSQGYCLLQMGDSLWLADIKEGDKIGAHVWSIYLLVPESTKGSAQWEYAPMLSSRIPHFRFEVGMEYDELIAICNGGTLSYYGAGEDEIGDAVTVPAGEALYWSPHDEDGSLVEQSRIHIAVQKDGVTACFATVYLSGDRIEETGRTVYTARLVGTGLAIGQSSEGEGAIIRLQ